MSSTLPPPPPPSGPPSGPEYLDSGHGAPLPPPERRGSGLRKGLVIGGTVIGLGAVGAAAWAAYGFLSTGAQPAEALPAGTLGYVSIDLDPSGGQKIEALRTLDKFPAFKDKVGITGDSDLRKTIFEKLQADSPCQGLDYDSDIEPWLGDRAAIAAVDTGDESPMPVVVVQVKDADKAAAGFAKLRDCGGSDTASGGWAFDGDWAVVAESTDIAEKVVSETEDGSLADDADFKKWTGETGDAGVMTMYAGPAAGDYLADHADELGMLAGPFAPAPGEVFGPQSDSGTVLSTSPAAYTTSADDSSGSGLSEQMKKQLQSFQGMAATVRFSDGAIELETAGDAKVGSQFLASGGTADVVSSLPKDTVAAFGLGFGDGWFSGLVDYVASASGMSSSDLLDQMSQATGLDLPQDADALACDSAALAVGPGFDPEKLFESGDLSDLPVGLKVAGDPDAIQNVLDKLIAVSGDDGTYLGTDSGDGAVAVGPSSDYRSQLLGDGGLGDTATYKDVVRESDKASTVFFLNVDQLQSALEGMGGSGGGEQELLDNLEPVAAVGASSWIDGGVAHGVLRITTDK